MFKLICRLGIKPKFCDLKSLFANLDIHVWARKGSGIVIQVNLNKQANYIIVWAQTMVTNATSYDELVGGGRGGEVDMVYHSWFYLLCVVCVTISRMVNVDVITQNNF
jgi:hypothetical protein